MNHKTEPWRSSLVGPTELDALLDRVREDKADTTGKNRNAVAYDCWRMFEDLAKRFKEESAMRDRYKRVVEACRGAFKLPRPWMDGGITYAEWDAAFTAIEEALAWQLPELFRPNEAPYDWNGQDEL